MWQNCLISIPPRYFFDEVHQSHRQSPQKRLKGRALQKYLTAKGR